MRVAILVFPGVEELDFVGFLDVLAVANRVLERKYFDTRLVGTQNGPIRCRGGMRVIPDSSLSELGEHDLLFVPGGGFKRSSGVDLVMKNKIVLRKLEESYGRGKEVWSVCTGAFILAKAGLLRGKRAVTHHSYLGELRSTGAIVVRQRTVADGRVTTGGGVSSSIDVGLKLVEEKLGPRVRKSVQLVIEYPAVNTRKKSTSS